MATSLELLQDLFKDRPDALTIFTLESLEADKIKEKLRNSNELFAANVNMYVTGRVGAGKTALGNCLLSEKTVMNSTGFQDCTREIGWFKLASNLRYYDLPGVASNINFENINRAALLIPQTKDEFSEPPIKPLADEDTLDILDFSNCKTTGDNPEKEKCLVGDWQSEDNQELVAPDVIIYVLAPDKQFLQPDRKYLGELLEAWKKRKQKCVVITALNIFRNEDGSTKATPENMEYAYTEIPKVYRVVHKNEWIPPIVEINSKTGEGIERLTEIICQVLPANQIGNMQTVLKDELKQYAEQERSNRYYRNLSLIAGRLSRYKSDKSIAGQNIFQAAASAISTYGVMTFKGIDSVADIRNQIDDISEKAERVKKVRQEDITVEEDLIGDKDVTEVKPITKTVTVEGQRLELQERKETVTDHVKLSVSKVVKKSKTVMVPGKVTVEQEKWWGDNVNPTSRIETYTDANGKEQKRYYHLVQIDGMVEKVISEDVVVTDDELKEITKDVIHREWVPVPDPKTEERIVGYETVVVDTIKVVIGQINKVVGTKFLAGGYPAIQLLLGIGLGVQNFCSSTSADWQTSLDKGDMTAERMLLPYKSKIEQLVEIPEGENELVKILETALIGANSPTALGGK